MPKRKTKKQSGLTILLTFIIFGLMTAACFMPFAESLVCKSSIGGLTDTTTYGGWKLIFGTPNSDGQLENTNITLVVAFALACAAALFSLIALLLGCVKKGNKGAKLLAILAGLLGLASGVMFLLAKQILDVENASATLFGITAKAEYTLGPGFLFPGIFGCASGASAIALIIASL